MVICPCIWQHWRFSVWCVFLGDLCLNCRYRYMEWLTVLCHWHHSGSVVWAVRYTLYSSTSYFTVCILWSYVTYSWTRLRIYGLDNARCALKISLWAWSNCVDLYRPSFCLNNGKVFVLIGLVNYFTDYFDILWPSGRVVVTVTKGLSPDFLL